MRGLKLKCVGIIGYTIIATRYYNMWLTQSDVWGLVWAVALWGMASWDLYDTLRPTKIGDDENNE